MRRPPARWRRPPPFPQARRAMTWAAPLGGRRAARKTRRPRRDWAAPRASRKRAARVIRACLGRGPCLDLLVDPGVNVGAAAVTEPGVDNIAMPRQHASSWPPWGTAGPSYHTRASPCPSASPKPGPRPPQLHLTPAPPPPPFPAPASLQRPHVAVPPTGHLRLQVVHRRSVAVHEGDHIGAAERGGGGGESSGSWAGQRETGRGRGGSRRLTQTWHPRRWSVGRMDGWTG